MGKKKTFKADKRDFEKEIHNVMWKDAREEKKKKKAEEIARTQRTTLVDEESTSGGMTEKSKIPTTDGERDEDFRIFLETFKGT